MIQLLLLTCFTLCLLAQDNKKGPKGSQERWETVLHWLKPRVPSIYVDERIVMRPGRFGDQVLSAADHIEKGEFLLQLPVQTFLWEEECFPSEEITQLGTGYVSSLKTFPTWKVATTDGPDYTQVALCLLIHRLLGNQSVYEPYLKQLPQQAEAFMFHTSDEFEVLRGTDTFRTLKALQNRQKRILDDGPGEIFPMVRGYLPNLNISDDQLRSELEQALSLCGSRTFHMDSEMLAPNKTIQTKVFRPVLVPLIDFMNHGDMRTRNCQYYFNRTYQHFQLQTIRAIQPGEELVMSYGLRANWELLIYYGFSMPGNLEDYVSVSDLALQSLEFNFRLRLAEIEKARDKEVNEKVTEKEGEKSDEKETDISSHSVNATTTSSNHTTTHTTFSASSSLRCYAPYFRASGQWPPVYQVTIKNASPSQNNTPLSLGPLSPSIYYALYKHLQPPHSFSVKKNFLALAENSKGINLQVLRGEVSVTYKNGSQVQDYANESLSSHGDLIVTLHWKDVSPPLSCKQSEKTPSYSSSASSLLCQDKIKNDDARDSVAAKCAARNEEEELREEFRLRRRIIRAAQLHSSPEKIFPNGLLPQGLAAIKIASVPSLSAFEVHRILGGGQHTSEDTGVSRTLTVFCFEEISRRLQVLGVETEEDDLKLLLEQARNENLVQASKVYEQLARNDLAILTHFCTLIADWNHSPWD